MIREISKRGIEACFENPEFYRFATWNDFKLITQDLHPNGIKALTHTSKKREETGGRGETLLHKPNLPFQVSALHSAAQLAPATLSPLVPCTVLRVCITWPSCRCTRSCCRGPPRTPTPWTRRTRRPSWTTPRDQAARSRTGTRSAGWAGRCGRTSGSAGCRRSRPSCWGTSGVPRTTTSPTSTRSSGP